MISESTSWALAPFDPAKLLRAGPIFSCSPWVSKSTDAPGPVLCWRHCASFTSVRPQQAPPFPMRLPGPLPVQQISFAGQVHNRRRSASLAGADPPSALLLWLWLLWDVYLHVQPAGACSLGQHAGLAAVRYRTSLSNQSSAFNMLTVLLA